MGEEKLFQSTEIMTMTSNRLMVPVHIFRRKNDKYHYYLVWNNISITFYQNKVYRD